MEKITPEMSAKHAIKVACSGQALYEGIIAFTDAGTLSERVLRRLLEKYERRVGGDADEVLNELVLIKAMLASGGKKSKSYRTCAAFGYKPEED